MFRILLAVVLASCGLRATAAFKCVDEKGVSHYEDVPPAVCANVVIYEVGPSGHVVRRIEPGKPALAPPPPDSAKKAETDRAALDRERRDRTLLDTFASEREIDTARDRSLELVNARLEGAQRQLELVRKRRRQLEASAASQKQAPAARADVDQARAEEAALEHSIAGYRAEMERVQNQFETDKVRWRELRKLSGRR
jgi:Domain of unknown function (DUF4124)